MNSAISIGEPWMWAVIHEARIPVLVVINRGGPCGQPPVVGLHEQSH